MSDFMLSDFMLIPPWYGSFLAAMALGTTLLLVVGQMLRPKFLRIHGAKAPWHAFLAFVVTAPGQLWQLAWIALLLLPFWWLAGVVVAVAPVDNTTAVFGALVGLYYVGWLVRGFMRGSNPAFRATAARDAQPPERVRRVAVIGAGMAGLTAAKELAEEGHEVVVFESASDWGGVWNTAKAEGGMAWDSTMTSTGSLNSVFSDSPARIYRAENAPTPMHFTRAQFFEMLEDYAERHNVWGDNRERLRLNTKVRSMDVQADGRWSISYDDDTGAHTELFDAVTVCTGLNEVKRIPEYPGQDRFCGSAIHSEQYEGPEAYAGMRVLVLGTGETAADVVKELVDHGAAHVCVSQHGPTLTLPRNGASVPPDYGENRLIYGGPMFNRYAMLILTIATTNSRLITPTRVPIPSPLLFFKMLFYGNPFAKFPNLTGSLGATKSDNLWFALDTGKASLHKEVARFDRSGATFIDGEKVDVDAIIYCTGFRRRASFLPTRAGASVPLKPPKELYKLTFDADLPNLAFIGLARGQVGAITISAEMQARWWALVVSGKRTLPTPERMRKEARWAARANANNSQPTRTTMSYINALARHEVGCEPDMFTLYRTEPRLWWQLLMGAMCAPHYRLHGVHAKPELARQQLLDEPGTFSTHDYIDFIDLSYNNLPLAFTAQPLWDLYSRLLPTYFFRSALSTYW